MTLVSKLYRNFSWIKYLNQFQEILLDYVLMPQLACSMHTIKILHFRFVSNGNFIFSVFVFLLEENLIFFHVSELRNNIDVY